MSKTTPFLDYQITNYIFFFLNNPAPPETYPLPLHDALPICDPVRAGVEVARGNYARRVRAPPTMMRSPQTSHAGPPRRVRGSRTHCAVCRCAGDRQLGHFRSEEHTSELQSQSNLVCRLLLEK